MFSKSVVNALTISCSLLLVASLSLSIYHQLNFHNRNNCLDAINVETMRSLLTLLKSEVSRERLKTEKLQDSILLDYLNSIRHKAAIGKDSVEPAQVEKTEGEIHNSISQETHAKVIIVDVKMPGCRSCFPLINGKCLTKLPISKRSIDRAKLIDYTKSNSKRAISNADLLSDFLDTFKRAQMSVDLLNEDSPYYPNSVRKSDIVEREAQVNAYVPTLAPIEIPVNIPAYRPGNVVVDAGRINLPLRFRIQSSNMGSESMDSFLKGSGLDFLSGDSMHFKHGSSTMRPTTPCFEPANYRIKL